MKKIEEASCRRCGRSFNSGRALRQHLKAKHVSYYLASRVAPILLIVVLLPLGVVFGFPGLPPGASPQGDSSEGLLVGRENLAMHIHVQLRIFVDGEEIRVPANIGILPDGRQ